MRSFRLLLRSIRLLYLAGVIPAAYAEAQTPPGTLERRKLSIDTVTDGVPCARSTRAPAEFHPGGRLAGCALSRAFAVGAHRFGARSWLDFDARGTLWGAWLEEDTPLAGHTCRGGGFKAWSVRFHPNGALAGCYLARDTVVAGVPCMRGTFLRELRGGGKSAMLLHPDGRLRQCQVARETSLDGRVLRKWAIYRPSVVDARTPSR